MTGAGAKALYAPLPMRALTAGLSGLQLSVLFAVCAHDRMSLVTGKGRGCTASNQRLASLVGCHYSRLCVALTDLEELGFLERSKHGRNTVYRVIYNDEDRLLFGNISDDRKDCAPATNTQKTGCAPANQNTETCCVANSQTRQKPPKTDQEYIPLKGVIDSVETGKHSSAEAARRLSRDAESAVRERSVGEVLGILEHRMKHRPETILVQPVMDYLEQVMDDHDHSDTEYRWAERLSHEIYENHYDRDDAAGIAG